LCYHDSLRLAAEKKASAIVFPCISTGVFGYPKPEACAIVSETVIAWLAENDHPERIVFCRFIYADVNLYQDRLRDRLDRC
jgi:O-acetyl-ADP-ribose deacetylase